MTKVWSLTAEILKNPDGSYHEWLDDVTTDKEFDIIHKTTGDSIERMTRELKPQRFIDEKINRDIFWFNIWKYNK